MPSVEEQKMGVLLGIKARKLGIASIAILFLFAWTGFGVLVSILCCMIGIRDAKRAKALAPDSPVVQSAYMINNIMNWFFAAPFILMIVGIIIAGILALLGVITI